MKRKIRSVNTNSSSNHQKNSLVRFKDTTSGLLEGVNFSESESENIISKKALIIVEGNHTDNNGKKHSFTADDIEWFAESTNKFLENGGRVPWQEDHNKSQKNNIGDLESFIVTKTITNDDLPDPKLKSLVGKVGAFAMDLVGKGKDVVDQIRMGRIKTLSPGIDMRTGIIREISATPTPAIVGMSIFSRGNNHTAMTWEEAESVCEMDDSLREEYQEMTDTLWIIAGNIVNAHDDEIPMSNREAMFDEALQGFVERFSDLLGINDGLGDYPMEVDRIEPNAQAQHRTEKLTLSENLSNLAQFKKTRTRHRGIAVGLGPVGGFAGGLINREGAAITAGVYRRKRRRKKRRRN